MPINLSDANEGINFVPKSQSPDTAGLLKEFAQGLVPTGWLLCDGSAVSRTVYSELFATIGTTYGVGDGSTTFNVPNEPSLYDPVNMVVGIKAFTDAVGVSFGIKNPEISTQYTSPGLLGSSSPMSGTFSPDASSGYGISYNPGTGIFTFDIAGKYEVSGMVFFNRSGGGHNISRAQVMYAGTISGTLFDSNAGASLQKFTDTVSLSGIFNYVFQVNDTIQFTYTINTNIAGNIVTGVNHNFISLKRVGDG